jgi:hypothetical protein
MLNLVQKFCKNDYYKEYSHEILINICYYYYIKQGYWKDIEMKSFKFSGINAVGQGLCQLFKNEHFEFRINEVFINFLYLTAIINKNN